VQAVDLGFEAHGVHVGIECSPELCERVRQVLPPGASPRDSAGRDPRWHVVARADGTCDLSWGRVSVARGAEPERAMDTLEAKLRRWVAERSTERVFVHAAAVAVGDRVLLLPGESHAGKTTLAAELVRAGAVYFSDEYAVLDEAGLVHPFPKRLSLRSPGTDATVETSVLELGGVAGVAPARVGLVALTKFVPDARFAPRELGAADAALGLLANTVVARDRPAEALRVVRAAVAGARAVEGERGEARLAAPLLLAALAE
jgi:hypothetical protein